VDPYGQVHHTDVIAEPIKDSNGNVVGAIEIANSVEEQFQTAEKLERLNNEYESVIYALSHDLRSPLVSIEGFIRKLEKKYLDNGQDGAKHCIQRIRANVRMMNDFVKVLLDTSRIATGEFEILPTDMEALVQEVIDSMQDRAEKQGAIIDKEGEFPMVECDRVRAMQVFSNLVSNALSHCKETPDLHIRIMGQKGLFSVRDNGPGMDEEFRTKAFEPFSQGSRNSDDHFGMGMNIVFKIIEKHGGEIWIESEEDRGTNVSFTLAPPPYRGVIEA
jgi:signal transduction histidine kinase